jgi:hypothetical protein
MRAGLLSAAMLLGSASAGVHKMKLTKIPLTEQLVSDVEELMSAKACIADRTQENADIAAHVQHLGQKYMGVRPDSHVDEMFKDTSVRKGDGHHVGVNNFLNAQCTCGHVLSCPADGQTSPTSPSARLPRASKSSSTPAAPIFGSHLRAAGPLRATCTPNMTRRPRRRTGQMERISLCSMDRAA